MSSLISNGQNKFNDTTAQIVAYWQKGDKKLLHFKKIKEKKDERESKIDSIEYSATIEILEETKDSYTIKWQYNRYAINEFVQQLFSDYKQLGKPLNIIYKTNETGGFQEVINLNEIEIYLEETFEFVETLLSRGKEIKNINDVKEAMKQLKTALSSRTGIENVILREIQFFHTFFGGEYSLNEKPAANIELPNTFGGDPFKARIQVELQEINKKENYFILEMQQFVDREQSKQIIIDIVRKLMPNNKTINAETLNKEIANFNVEDVCIQKINAQNCWVKSMSYKRKVSAGQFKNCESIELKVQ